MHGTSSTSAEAQADSSSGHWDAVATPRLLLREFTQADIEGYYRLESNEENARYQDWPPRTMEQAQDLVLANIQNVSASPRTTWELVVEHAGRMIGRVGAASSQPQDSNSTRLAIHFDLWFSFLPEVHGQGYATEAMEAFIEVLTQKQDAGRVELEIECDPRNTGSWKLAEKLGFQRHSLTERAWESKREWVDSLVYRKVVEGHT
jgi:RimJ/RimL family protein N-acetyltransferase